MVTSLIITITRGCTQMSVVRKRAFRTTIIAEPSIRAHYAFVALQIPVVIGATFIFSVRRTIPVLRGRCLGDNIHTTCHVMTLLDLTQTFCFTKLTIPARRTRRITVSEEPRVTLDTSGSFFIQLVIITTLDGRIGF